MNVQFSDPDGDNDDNSKLAQMIVADVTFTKPLRIDGHSVMFGVRHKAA